MSAPLRFESLLQRLGRTGIPPTPAAAEIPHDRISRDETQPRKVFNEERLVELAASISAVGIIEPLVVRPDPDRQGFFIIIAGERRHLAAGLAGLATVPAIVRETSDAADIKLIQLIENLQRVDLNLKERALGLKDLEVTSQLPSKDLAKLLGMAPGTLSNYKRVLRATGPAAAAVDENLISSPETLRLFENLDQDQQESLLKVARKTGAPISRPVVLRFLERQPKSSSVKEEQVNDFGTSPSKVPQTRQKLQLHHYVKLFHLLGLTASEDVADMHVRLFALLDSSPQEN